MMGTILENIAIDGNFTKHIPKEVRGTMNGIYYLFGNIGVLIFAKVSGYLYDNVGPKSPFIIVGTADLLFGMFVIIMKLTGKLKSE